jgi:chromatin remodeling complex protein RSC6
MAKEAKEKKSKFMQPMQVSEELAAVVGRGPLPRTEVTKKLWAYIKANKCQDAKNKRNINPDDKLAKILGKKAVNMFEMTKLVSKHLS